MLRAAFSILGIAALLIGGMIFVAGPQVTGQAFASLFRIVSPATPRIVGLSGPDINSEMRFYSVLWIAYGAMALWVARALQSRIKWFRLMLAVFLPGGVGRPGPDRLRQRRWRSQR